MERALVRLRLMIVASTFCACFIASVHGASTIAERAYLIVRYGPDAVQREHLHVVRYKPRLRISNGDEASELGTFAPFPLGLLLGLIFLSLGIGLTGILTKLSGRKVSIIQDLPHVQRTPPPDATRRLELRELLTGFAIFAITFAATSKLFGQDDLWTWLRHYAAMIIVYSILLRLVFIGAAAPVIDGEASNTMARKRPFIWPL